MTTTTPSLDFDDLPGGADWLKPGLPLVAQKLLRAKINTEHVPAGSPAGGQFAPKGGGGAADDATVGGKPPASFGEGVKQRYEYLKHFTDLTGPNDRAKLDAAAERSSLQDVGALNQTILQNDGTTNPYRHGQFLTSEQIAAASGGKLTPERARDFVASWIGGADNPESVALNQAVAEKFDLPINETQASRISKTQDNVAGGKTTYFTSGDRITGGYGELLTNARAFADAQYAVTQKWYADHGYQPDDRIVAYRGYAVRDSEMNAADSPYPSKMAMRNDWQPVDVVSRPATSWGADSIIARSFQEMNDYSYTTPLIMGAHIRVKDILSTAWTGAASSAEAEYVVIGGPRKVWVKA